MLIDRNQFQQVIHILFAFVAFKFLNPCIKISIINCCQKLVFKEIHREISNDTFLNQTRLNSYIELYRYPILFNSSSKSSSPAKCPPQKKQIHLLKNHRSCKSDLNYIFRVFYAIDKCLFLLIFLLYFILRYSLEFK